MTTRLGTRPGAQRWVWPIADIPAFLRGDAELGCGPGTADLFFPGSGDYAGILAARRVCFNCPVMDECRDYAVADPSLAGIWGGTTGNERKELRRYGADRGARTYRSLRLQTAATRLREQGWGIYRIATHMHRHPDTIRGWLRNGTINE